MVVATKVPTQIVKRDGTIVEFKSLKIYEALEKCFDYVWQGHPETKHTVDLNDLVNRVVNVLAVKYVDKTPTVENVQDTVVFVLQSSGEYDAAEHYIIYRYEHAKQREQSYIPDEIKEAYKVSSKYFPTALQEFQYFDKYSKFDDELGRRETWPETVERTISFLDDLACDTLKERGEKYFIENNGEIAALLEEVEKDILEMKVIPSMRLMAMAGPAARRENAAIYNCSYLPIDGVDAFCELMYLLMQGCGVGFSVESYNVDKIPKINSKVEFDTHYHLISDTTEGWVEALRCGIETWFNGSDVSFDYSQIRAQGTPLKTKGGRASGPEPLRECLDFIRNRIFAKAGKRLTTLDCHDIACAIARAVVSGGVRRSATISLFDEDDKLMETCKSGDFEEENNQRWSANNSAVWTNVENMTQMEFMRRMWTMFESKRGEPGIFSREIAIRTMPVRRSQNNKDVRIGSNPCGEIPLRPWQFCNLSSVVARKDDTLETLKAKVRSATIIGTIQSCATYFPGLRSTWAFNCKQERLLGVDITGQMDCDLLNWTGPIEHRLEELKKVAIETNKWMADLLGINPSAAITCVKPSGNSSVLLDASPGLHPRWSEYYIRNVRVTANSPMYYTLKDAGVPLEAENGQDPSNPSVWVASFPVKSPEGAKVRAQVSAVEQFNRWLENKKYWTEHNPSVSIYYRPEEVLDLLNALWENRMWLGGVSFFPYSDAKYKQLPYYELTKEEYEAISPVNIDFSKLWLYDQGKDFTNATSTAACEGPVCDLPN